MATIVIPAINWGNPPDSNQNITLEYKLWSDTSYTLIGNNLEVDPDGNILESPLPSVTGLTDGTTYDIRAYNECSSPIDYIIIAVNT